MALIHVPRPSKKSVMDPNRPVNSLLRVQIEHLHEAELKLPAGQQTQTYINAIKTEGEAGRYIREVTEAIQRAHANAGQQRRRVSPRRKPGFEIAAVAEEKPRKKRKALSKKIKTKTKSKTNTAARKGRRK